MPHVPLTSLISYWRMDETSGTRVDVHGSNDFTDNNTVGSRAGVIGNGAVFVRANSESLSVANNSDLQSGNVDWWVNYWMVIDSKPGDMQLFTRRESGTVIEFWSFWTSPDRIGTNIYNGASTALGSVITDPAPATGALAMFSLWHDASLSRVFQSINAQAVPDEVTLTGDMGVGTISTRIGAIHTTPIEFFDGLIDEVSWWKRIPLQSELESLYNSRNGLAYPFRHDIPGSLMMLLNQVGVE